MSSNTTTTDDYESYETPKEVYIRLIELINNQRESPELLQYEESVIDCIVEQIEHMNDNIKRLNGKLDPFCVSQHRTELERLSFAQNQYFRTRIEKIESNAISLIKSLQTNTKYVQKLMSKNEIKYLDNYVSNIDKYLNESVLGRLPFNRTSIMNFKLIDVPINDSLKFENTYVFVKALKATQVIVDDSSGQETIQLDKDSQHFLPYSAVRRHLITGSRDLLLI
jgi:GINS complex subunit 4